MIPLGSERRIWRVGFINLLVVLANVGVYAYEIKTSLLRYAASTYGMVPRRLVEFFSSPNGADWFTPLTLFTSLFLHADILHLAGNMLYLLIFGPAVESGFGKLRYLFFYLASGVVGAMAMVWMYPRSGTPVVGSSGAIAGVLGAYFVMYPRARVLTLLPLPFMLTTIRVPAAVYLLIWFGFQLYAGSSVSNRIQTRSVAWWAHIGGFLFGVAMSPFLRQSDKKSPHKVKRLSSRKGTRER